MGEISPNGQSLEARFMRHLYDDSIGGYHDDRKRLLDAESEQSWDHDAKSSSSTLEHQANGIFRMIRENERTLLFGDRPGEHLPAPDTRDMGGRFLVNKDRIEASRIYQIAKRIPKGCHLHVHMNSELPIECLLCNIRRLPQTMFIKSSRRLVDPEDFSIAEILFDVFPEDHPQVDIFTAKEFNPGTCADENDSWMKWAVFRQSFPGGSALSDTETNNTRLDAAELWISSKITFNADRAYNTMQTLNGAWAYYNQCTRAFKGLLGSESLYRWYVQECIDHMVEERIYYAEWRPMLMNYTIASDDGRKRLDVSAQMVLISQVIREKKAQWGERFRFGVKIIYCVPRSIPHKVMQSELINCIRLKKMFPDLLCGLDLVGAEDRPYNLGHYVELLLSFQKTCIELGLEIPFLLHAGETLLDTGGTHFAEHSNLYDALLLKAKRIGHGMSLTRHPMLAEEYKRRGIALEICPISHELLHLCSNAKSHRLPDLLAMGLHCTISADNPAIFKSSLSHDIYQVLVGSVSMTLSGYRQLVDWSIEHSCLNEDEKAEARGMLKTDWNEFLHWIVEEYGPHVSTLRYQHLL